MRRLFFLTPDVDSCQNIIKELKATGVPQRHLHVIASIEQPLDDLPEAGMLQKTELLHGFEIGAGLGGTAGILGGLLAMTFPPAGIVLGGGALLAGAAAGAGFGAVVSALMSSHEHNHELLAFQRAIEAGRDSVDGGCAQGGSRSDQGADSERIILKPRSVWPS